MTLVEWLDLQKDIDGSLSITMFAMGKSWEGAVYTIDGSDDQCIYLLGEIPKDAEKLCFRFENDSRDWYVATDFQENLGKNWILHPWNLQEAIDHYENKTYKRIPASIQ